MDGVGVPRCVYSKLQRRPSFFANMFILSIVHISTFQPKFVYTKHMNICSCIVFISCGAPVQFRLRSREASPKLIKSFDGASSSRGCGGKFVQRIRRFPCARLGHDGPGWSAERLLRAEHFRIINCPFAIGLLVDSENISESPTAGRFPAVQIPNFGRWSCPGYQ